MGQTVEGALAELDCDFQHLCKQKLKKIIDALIDYDLRHQPRDDSNINARRSAIGLRTKADALSLFFSTAIRHAKATGLAEIEIKID